MQEVNAELRRLFVVAARDEIVAAGMKANVSRLSVGTGMHRGEVKRILEGPELPQLPIESLDVVTRLIGQWRHDPRFLNASGEPRILEYRGENSEFRVLARTVSTAVHSGTMIAELERMGAIEKTPRGLRLVVQAEPSGANVLKSAEILSQDLSSLLSAVTENIIKGDGADNLHIRTEYDNIFCSALPEIRAWMIERGKDFHRQAREFLSRHDKDVSPGSDQRDRAGARVVLGAFSVIESPSGDREESSKGVRETPKRKL